MFNVGLEEFGLILIVVVSYLIPVALFWVILGRAGFPPVLSLAGLVPGIGILAVLAVLAFMDWPRLPRTGDAAPPEYPLYAYPPPQPQPAPPARPPNGPPPVA